MDVHRLIDLFVPVKENAAFAAGLHRHIPFCVKVAANIDITGFAGY